MVRLLAERYDTKLKVKLDGFRSQLQASYAGCNLRNIRSFNKFKNYYETDEVLIFKRYIICTILTIVFTIHI